MVEIAVEEAFRIEGVGFRVGEEEAVERGVEEATTPSPADWLSPFSKGELEGVGFGLTITVRVDVALFRVASTPNFIHPQTLVFQHLRDSFSIQGGNGVATF